MPTRPKARKSSSKEKTRAGSRPQRALAAVHASAFKGARTTLNWGMPPWTIAFVPEPRPLPAQADSQVVLGVDC